MDPVLNQVQQKIQNALEHFKSDLATVRAGRANPSLIENVTVNAYGSQMKLVEVGTIASPQPNLLTVQVWDASIISDVVKAIQSANLGLNPSTEGQLIRLPIPPLTAERREEFVKLVHQKMEGAKVEIRQIRQETREELEKLKEAGEFGEDELERRMKLLQDQIDKASAQIEELGKAKEVELQQV